MEINYVRQMQQELSQQIGMEIDDWPDIYDSVKVIDVEAKHCLQRDGEAVTHHYFVVSGLVRLFYQTRDGKELNKAFYGENYIVGNLSAVILNEPSRFSAETLEPCKLIELPFNKLLSLYMHSPSWQKVFNHGCQMMLIRNERREAELLTMTAKQRFLQFNRNFSEYQGRIPQYHIASYLGITPEALSTHKKQWLSSTEKSTHTIRSEILSL
jgi:CRP-like cAMP-binding protein